MLRGFLLLLAASALAFVGFVIAVEHPATRGPLRCWITETFYDLSKEPAPEGTPVIQAVRTTEPVQDMCDAADDPAIWVNPADPLQSLILGTNKQSSVNVYDLSGALVSRTTEIGEPNNVDIREIAGKVVAVVSDKNDNEIEAFTLDSSRGLTPLPGAPFPVRAEEETYGICAYSSRASNFAFVTDKSGLISQYEFKREGKHWGAALVRSLRVSSQPEGCVVDDAANRLFVGEEDRGIWSFDARPDAPSDGTLIAQTVPGGLLTADIEGLAIYTSDEGGEGYLIASSQGDNTYAVFDRTAPHKFRGRFQVEYNGELIGDTDGLDITSATIGAEFPSGMLVIQDGFFRDSNGKRRNQRFAYVSWADVAEALGLE